MSMHTCIVHLSAQQFHKHLGQNMNHALKQSMVYDDISPQVFLCIDIPQNGENIYCLLFIV